MTIPLPLANPLGADGAASCKCCGGEAVPYGSADFNKSCEDHRGAPFAPAEIAVAYHRCGACGFLFTVAFDQWAPADFLAHIYNDDYARVDPDFVELRPRGNAGFIGSELFAGQTSLRILDFGGGNGSLAERLREQGFAGAQTFDPFYAGAGVPPRGSFDLVSCFEVLEHTPNPYDTLRQMRAFVADGGMMLFSTLLQPPDLDDVGLAWWYAAPRNGHVSLYSPRAMTALMKRIGFKWASFNDVFHVAYRSALPRFARHLRVHPRV